MKKVKLIDERGRLFGVISVVDILAVLVVAALALMAYMRFFSGGEANVSDSGFVPVTYQIKVFQIRENTANSFKVNDRIWSSDGEDLGVITAVETAQAEKLANRTDGTVVLMPVEDYVDATFTVEVDGTVNGDRYYAGRTFELGVNGSVEFVSKYASTSGKIWSVG